MAIKPIKFLLYTGVTEEFEVGFSNFGQASFKIIRDDGDAFVANDVEAGDVLSIENTKGDPNGNPDGTYTVDSPDLSFPTNYSFSWKSSDEEVGTNRTITVTQDMIEKTISCNVSYVDNHGFNENVEVVTDTVLGGSTSALEFIIDTNIEINDFIDRTSSTSINTLDVGNEFNAASTSDEEGGIRQLYFKRRDNENLDLEHIDKKFRIYFKKGITKTIRVNWGDGTSDSLTRDSQTEFLEHEYNVHGYYIIKIFGDVPLCYGDLYDREHGLQNQAYLTNSYNDEILNNIKQQYQQKIVKITNFSDFYKFTHGVGVFKGAINLIDIQTSNNIIFDSTVNDCSEFFENCWQLQDIGPVRFTGIDKINRTFLNCFCLNDVDFDLSGVKSVINTFDNVGLATNYIGAFDYMLDPEWYSSSLEFYYPQDPLELGFKNLSSIETGIDQNTQENFDREVVFLGQNVYNFFSSESNLPFSENTRNFDYPNRAHQQRLSPEKEYELLTGISGAIADGNTFFTNHDFYLGYTADINLPWKDNVLNYLHTNGFKFYSDGRKIDDALHPNTPVDEIGNENIFQPFYGKSYYNHIFNGIEFILDGFISKTTEGVDYTKDNDIRIEVFSSAADRAAGTNRIYDFAIGMVPFKCDERNQNLFRPSSKENIRRHHLNLKNDLFNDHVNIPSYLERTVPVYHDDDANRGNFFNRFKRNTVAYLPLDHENIKYNNYYLTPFGVIQQLLLDADRPNEILNDDIVVKLLANPRDNFLKLSLGTIDFKNDNVFDDHIIDTDIFYPFDYDNDGVADDTIGFTSAGRKYKLEFDDTQFDKDSDGLPNITNDSIPSYYIRNEGLSYFKPSFRAASHPEQETPNYTMRLINQTDEKMHRVLKKANFVVDVETPSDDTIEFTRETIDDTIPGLKVDQITLSRVVKYSFRCKPSDDFPDENVEALFDFYDGDVSTKLLSKSSLYKSLEKDNGDEFADFITEKRDSDGTTRRLECNRADDYEMARNFGNTESAFLDFFETDYRKAYGFGYVFQPKIKLNGKVVSRGYLLDRGIMPDAAAQRGVFCIRNKEIAKDIFREAYGTTNGQIRYLETLESYNDVRNFSHILNEVKFFGETIDETWFQASALDTPTEWVRDRSRFLNGSRFLANVQGFASEFDLNGAPVGTDTELYLNGADTPYRLIRNPISKKMLLEDPERNLLINYDYSQDTWYKENKNKFYTVPQLRGKVFNDYYQKQVYKNILIEGLNENFQKSDEELINIYKLFLESQNRDESDFDFPLPDMDTNKLGERLQHDTEVQNDGSLHLTLKTPKYIAPHTFSELERGDGPYNIRAHPNTYQFKHPLATYQPLIMLNKAINDLPEPNSVATMGDDEAFRYYIVQYLGQDKTIEDFSNGFFTFNDFGRKEINGNSHFGNLQFTFYSEFNGGGSIIPLDNNSLIEPRVDGWGGSSTKDNRSILRSDSANKVDYTPKFNADDIGTRRMTTSQAMGFAVDFGTPTNIKSANLITPIRSRFPLEVTSNQNKARGFYVRILATNTDPNSLDYADETSYKLHSEAFFESAPENITTDVVVLGGNLNIGDSKTTTVTPEGGVYKYRFFQD